MFTEPLNEPYTVDPDAFEALIEMMAPDLDEASFRLTDAGHAALEPAIYTETEADRALNKGCGLTIGTVEVMGSESLTIVQLIAEFTFPVRRANGTLAYETWVGDVTGEAKKDPRDKPNASLGTLVAFQDAIGKLHRDITRRVEGELKHAEDMKLDGKRRRALKAAKNAPVEPKKGGHAKKAAKKAVPAHLLERSRSKKK